MIYSAGFWIPQKPIPETEFFPIYVDGNCGFIDEKGAVIIEPKYAENSFLMNGYLYEITENKYVIYDMNGNVVKQLSRTFELYHRSNNGYFSFYDKSNPRTFGLADSMLNIIEAPVFDSIEMAYGDYMIVTKNAMTGLINNQGQFSIPAQYDDIKYTGNGIVRVYLRGKCGVFDLNGKTIIPIAYDVITECTDGRMWVNKGATVNLNNYSGGKWALFDKNGHALTGFDFNNVGIIHQDSTPIIVNKGAEQNNYSVSGGEWGAIDKNGKQVIQFLPCDCILDFCYDVAKIRIKGKWGLIDKNGRQVLPCMFSTLETTEEQVYIVNLGGSDGGFGKPLIGGKNALLDKTGKVIFEASEYITFGNNYTNGILTYRDGNICGFIDSTGKKISFLTYDDVEPFKDGYARVRSGFNIWYVDKKGNRVYGSEERRLLFNGYSYRQFYWNIDGKSLSGIEFLDGHTILPQFTLTRGTGNSRILYVESVVYDEEGKKAKTCRGYVNLKLQKIIWMEKPFVEQK